MSKNLGLFDRFTRILGGSIFLLLSVFVFQHPVSRLLAILIGLWLLLEAISGACPLYHYMGMRKVGPMRPETVGLLVLAGVQVVLGYEWWVAGWEKITDATFVSGLPRVLAFFAEKNPFPFMQQFLLGPATKYFEAFGFVVGFGEYLIGVVLIALAYAWLTAKSGESRCVAMYISMIAMVFGAIMNGVYFLAAGHTGAGTRGINIVMFWVQLVLIYGHMQLLLQNPRRGR
jgi:uncharacterized membrane protein (DUF485 family)